MRMRRLVLVAFVIALAHAPAHGAQNANGAAAANSVLKVALNSDLEHRIAVEPVKQQRLKDVIETTAMVEPDANAVAHITSRISGRVIKLVAQLGQRVKAGDPLVILNSIQLGEAKTNYIKARSLQEIARQHLDREQSLYAKKIAAQKDVLQARADYDTARAQYEAARETLRLLIPPDQLGRLNWNSSGPPLSEFALTSPISGVVVKRDLTVGSMVDSNDQPITVIDLDKLWVIANVFEHDVSGLRPGAGAAIKVEALPDRKFDGEVTYISDSVDPKTRTVQARIEVPNPEHLLKLGMFAHARIESVIGTREVLGVPDEAVFDVGGKKIVFVALGGGRYEPRPVRIGEAGVDVVAIDSGLKPGEQVVTRGGLVLKAMMLNRAE
jgi:cobalt-zinc-cadmium efflux system membrane fusion protein